MNVKPHILVLAETDASVLAGVIEAVGPRALELVTAARFEPLNRYKMKPGRIFGIPKSKERWKIVELSGNIVVYKDLLSGKMAYTNVNTLLEKWNLQGVMEITQIDAILAKIKEFLTPFLGGVIVAGLISWLLKKVG